ncbi:LysR family transcriptional regulator [Zeimonas arvi]|nr:LysR family transcriptional regulator [Zeimonas arvi]
MVEWDDLRYFVSLGREGSTLAASRALGVDQSTVQRRVAALEKRLGRPLVARGQSGYRLTDFGRALLGPAQDVHAAVERFEQSVAEAVRGEAGVVRVTCPEPIVLRLQRAGLVDRFHARHPGLRIEFLVSDRYMDLMQGDADVALRSGDTDDGELVGRRIADSIWAVYGSRDYLAAHGRPARVEDLRQHALIGLDDSMSRHRAAAWLREIAPDAPLVARNGSVLGLLHSAKAGLGLAPLPVAIAEAEPDLERVLGPIPALRRIWRVLTPPHLRHEPRVAAFFDFVVAEAEALAPVLTG